MNDGLEWGTVGQWASPIVTLFVAIWAVKRSGNKEAIDGLKDDIRELRDDDARQFERIDEIETKVARVETIVEHLPKTEDLHRIALEQTRQGEMLRGFGDVLAGLAGSVKAIERALLERDAREERR